MESAAYSRGRSRGPAGAPSPSGATAGVASAAAPAGDVRGRTLRKLLVGADLVALSGAFALVTALASAERPFSDFVALVVCMPLWLVIASALGMYELPERHIDHSLADEAGRTVLVATAWGWSLLLAEWAIEPGSTGVGHVALIWIASAGAVLSVRAIARHLVATRRWFRQRVLVLGAGPDAARVVRRLGRHPEYGLEVVGVAKLDPMPRKPGTRYDPTRAASRDGIDTEEASDPASGLLGRVRRLVARFGANRVVLATAPTDLEERSELVRGLIGDRVAVDLVAAEPDGWSSMTALHNIEGLPMLTVSPVRPSRLAHLGKRIGDVLASGLALILLSPAFAYVAIRIKLDSPGPVFFRQRRIGRDGREFRMIKFRTMEADADLQKPEIDELNMHSEGERGRMFKIPSDPRITGFGVTLRRWSIDELPQLINVLRGDMGLVGPRPLISAEEDLVDDHYAERRRIRPGITGPWQVHGRSDIGFDDMVRLDYFYAMHWSLAEDARILLRTAGAVFRGRGAY